MRDKSASMPALKKAEFDDGLYVPNELLLAFMRQLKASGGTRRIRYELKGHHIQGDELFRTMLRNIARILEAINGPESASKVLVHFTYGGRSIHELSLEPRGEAGGARLATRNLAAFHHAGPFDPNEKVILDLGPDDLRDLADTRNGPALGRRRIDWMHHEDPRFLHGSR